MTSRSSRVQEVVVPILREAFPDVEVTTWIPSLTYRKYPIINVRRLGGNRNRSFPERLDNATVEITVHHAEGLPEAEILYTEVVDALFRAWRTQKVTEAGHIAFVREIMGLTSFDSQFQDNYRVQGLIQLGIRPPRKG